MKSIVNVNLLGGDSAVRNRMMNMGHNGWLNADILLNFKNKVSGLTLLPDLNAVILSPYVENMNFYNMAGTKERDELEFFWRSKYGTPIGWAIQHGYFYGSNVPGGSGDNMNYGPVTFQPGGKYHQAYWDKTDKTGVEFADWQDFYYRNCLQEIFKDVNGKLQYPPSLYHEAFGKFAPVFEMNGSKRSDVGLLYWHQKNNLIVDSNVSKTDATLKMFKWTLRSYDPEGSYDTPKPDVKTVESSGTGQTNYLKSDQGIYLSFLKSMPITGNFIDRIADNFTEFCLYWTEPGGFANRPDVKVYCKITFAFTMQNHLKVSFYKKFPSEAGNWHEQTVPVAYKNSIGGKDSVDVFILFVNGNIVLLNKKLDTVATIPCPDWLRKTHKDVLDTKYDIITGENTKMSFTTYGECYFLASPVLYEPLGIIESEKYRTGEKLDSITTDFRSVIKSPMTPSNVVITTETGPDEIEDPSKSDINPESSDVRQEAFYTFTVTIQGKMYVSNNLDNPYVYNAEFGDYEKEILVATDTPILYSVKLFSPATPKSNDIPVTPNVANLNIDGANYRKSVDDSEQYNAGDLELSYDMYLNPQLPFVMNSPCLIKVGADASFENDFSADHLNESLNIGSVRRDIDPSSLGLFFVDRIANSRNAGNVFDIKKVIIMSDIIKKFQSTKISQKTMFDGKRNVDAIMDLAQLANLQGRIYVSPEDIEKSSSDIVLPVSMQGGGPQWIFEIDENIWDCMQRIRFVYGWVMYVDNNGTLVYKSYDRGQFNKDELMSRVKYLFVDSYNWENLGYVVQSQDKGYKVLPMSNFSDVEVDFVKTRVMVSGINARKHVKVLDSKAGGTDGKGEEIFANPGDKIQAIVRNAGLEESLGEIRLAAFEDKKLGTIEAIKQVAKCLARQLMRPKKVISFTVPIAELCLDLNLYDPILIGSRESVNAGKQNFELYEITSISYNIRPYDIIMDLECRSYPVE